MSARRKTKKPGRPTPDLQVEGDVNIPINLDLKRFSSETVSGSRAVDHPSHYGGDTTYEHIKVVAAWYPEEFPGYCKGNATKYLMRAGRKAGENTIQELEKAKFYVQALIDFEKSKS